MKFTKTTTRGEMKRSNSEADGCSNSERGKKVIRVFDTIGENLFVLEESGRGIQVSKENDGIDHSQVMGSQQFCTGTGGISRVLNPIEEKVRDSGEIGSSGNQPIIVDEDNKALRGSEDCDIGDRGGDGIGHGRDLGNMGPVTAPGNYSAPSGSVVDYDVRGKENRNLDLNAESLDFDLNLPAIEIEEGGNGDGFQDHTQLGAAQGVVEIVQISSDESEDEYRSGEQGGCITVHGGRRYTREEKGKAKLVDSSWLSLTLSSPVHPDLIPERQEQDFIKSADSSGGGVQLCEASQPEETSQLLETLGREPETTSATAEHGLINRRVTSRYRDIARDNAHRFARFNSRQEHYLEALKQGRQKQTIEVEKNVETFTGPFSTAMELVMERNLKHSAQQLINWKPLKDHDHNISMPLVPSLLDLCMTVLAKNAEAIVSLECVPHTLKHRLSDMLCDFRKMNVHTLELLVHGSPTEIRLKDCSWMTEEQFTKIFGSFDTKNLKVLQLDLCGQCVLGNSLGKTLARFPNGLPDLAIISLKGACRLTNVALKELIASAPAIQSINLSQCSLLTDDVIYILADSLAASLRELYIDNCQRIDAMLIAPAMKKFKHLEVLSVAGIQTVSDEFLINVITECGQNIKELDLADCLKLTNNSMEVIGITCSRLCSLNISNLHQLTDLALQYLANGCQSIQTLKLRQNNFSDEAVAAFLETSGKSLKQLSLNNVKKVGPNTALSLARCSKELLSLDLSWCRNITNEGLGLVVDSCLSLKLLKLFGCTQISDEFLNGHSNSQVRIIGLNKTPVLEHLNVLETEVAYLRYSPLTLSFDSQN